MTEDKSDAVSSQENIGEEKLRGEEIPIAISQAVENYIINGRPGLDGRLEPSFYTDVSRGKEMGARSGLCGYAAPFASEVVEKMNSEGKCNLAACVVQSTLLGKILPSDLYRRFRQHGFSIIVDRDLEKWWIIDTTLNQFVEKTEEGSLKMTGSKLDICNESPTATAVQSLLNNGFIDLTRDSLAVYISLMARYGPVDTQYTRDVSDSMLSRTDFKLDYLVTKCVDNKRWSVGNWGGSLARIPRGFE